MNIRPGKETELEVIFSVQEKAFGQPAEARLTAELLADPTAEPRLSLLAFQDDQAVGHILFTRVGITGSVEISAAILAPLAVVPDGQGQGIGGALIRAGLETLTVRNTDLVFVLGDPGYYTRFGFQPAGTQGLAAPFPIPPEHADAWMVQGLKEGLLGAVKGTVICADCLNKQEYWVE